MSKIRVQGLVVALCLIIMACADEKLSKVELYPFQGATGHWGYVDIKGEIKIEPQYDFAYPFEKGAVCARVEMNGKMGMVDEFGKLIVPPTIDKIEPFFRRSDGSLGGAHMWKYRTNAKYSQGGYVLPDGNFALPIFTSGFYHLEEWEWSSAGIGEIGNEERVLINRNGQLWSDVRYEGIWYHESSELITFKENGKWGIMNMNREVLVEPKYPILRVLKSDLLAFRNEAGLFGLMDLKENLIAKPKFREPDYDNELGLIRATVKGKKGLLTPNGKTELPFEYQRVGKGSKVSSEGLIAVRQNNKWGFLDSDLNIRVPLIYDEVDEFENGVSIVELGGKEGIIDEQGKYLLEPIYSKISPVVRGGRRRIEKDGKFGFLDENCELVIPVIYDYVTGFQEGGKGVSFAFFAFENDKEKVGIIDNKGNVVYPASIEGHSLFGGELRGGSSGIRKWSSIRNMVNSKGMFYLPMNGKWAILNRDFEFVHPPIFDKVSTIGMGGLFLVEFGDKKGYLSPTGDPVGFTKQDVFTEISRVNGAASRKIISDQLRNSSREASVVCYRCGGDGSINCEEHDSNGDGYCTNCKNTGFEECYVCHGSGRVSN